ncbi:unnamed protein product [Scytosiphon promiscuus]
MFSCNIIQRSHYSLAKPPVARRCSAFGRGLAQVAGSTGQISSTIRRSLPGESAATAAPGGPDFVLGVAAAGRPRDGVAAPALPDCNPGLAKSLKRDLVLLVGRWDMAESVAAVGHPAASIAAVNVAVHVPPPKVGDRQRQRQLRPGIPANAISRRRVARAGEASSQLDRRWFCAGTGPDGDGSGGSDTDRAASGRGRERSLWTDTGAGAPTAEGAPAKKIPKPRKPPKRRARKGESASRATGGAAAAGGEPGATSTKTTEAPGADAGAEAPAKATPKPRKPRKRRGGHDESGPASAAESTAPADSKVPAAAAAAAAEQAEREPAVDIPPERKESFQRARRKGVSQRIEEGGGVPRDGGSGGESGSQSSGEEGSESRDDAPFPWKEANAPPYTWQDPDTPARPKELPSAAGRSSEGGESGAAADNESGRGKAPRRRTQRKKSSPPQEPHPVLGNFVADLGYKRIYVTSIEALVKASVWEKSRTLHPVHSAEIFKAKKLEAQRLEVRRIKEGKKPTENLRAKGMPGIFTLYKRPLLPLTKKNQQYVLGIVDGQHRLDALLMLTEEGMWDPAERNVVVEVLDVADDRGIEEIFAEINSAEPIEIDLSIPGPDDIQRCADEVVLHLYKEYRVMFGGERIRPPSLHASTFKQNLRSPSAVQDRGVPCSGRKKLRRGPLGGPEQEDPWGRSLSPSGASALRFPPVKTKANVLPTILRQRAPAVRSPLVCCSVGQELLSFFVTPGRRRAYIAHAKEAEARAVEDDLRRRACSPCFSLPAFACYLTPL